MLQELDARASSTGGFLPSVPAAGLFVAIILGATFCGMLILGIVLVLLGWHATGVLEMDAAIPFVVHRLDAPLTPVLEIASAVVVVLAARHAAWLTPQAPRLHAAATYVFLQAFLPIVLGLDVLLRETLGSLGIGLVGSIACFAAGGLLALLPVRRHAGAAS